MALATYFQTLPSILGCFPMKSNPCMLHLRASLREAQPAGPSAASALSPLHVAPNMNQGSNPVSYLLTTENTKLFCALHFADTGCLASPFFFTWQSLPRCQNACITSPQTFLQGADPLSAIIWLPSLFTPTSPIVPITHHCSHMSHSPYPAKLGALKDNELW